MLLYGISFSVAALLLALDQWSKYWTDSNLELGEVRPLLGSVLELHCVHNYGVAWSLFSGMRWVLALVSGCIVLAVAAMLLLRLIRHPLGIAAAFLILSGGIGNLLDRIALGYVVDMLRFPFWHSYPTFNVADICVVSGCILWLIYALAVKEEEPAARPQEAGTPDSAAADDADDEADYNEFFNDFHFDRYRASSGGGNSNLSSSGNSSASGGNPSGLYPGASGGGTAGASPAVSNVDDKAPLPRESYRGTGGDWQEQWRRRQRERHGQRRRL